MEMVVEGVIVMGFGNGCKYPKCLPHTHIKHPAGGLMYTKNRMHPPYIPVTSWFIIHNRCRMLPYNPSKTCFSHTYHVQHVSIHTKYRMLLPYIPNTQKLPSFCTYSNLIHTFLYTYTKHLVYIPVPATHETHHKHPSFLLKVTSPALPPPPPCKTNTLHSENEQKDFSLRISQEMTSVAAPRGTSST